MQVNNGLLRQKVAPKQKHGLNQALEVYKESRIPGRK